MAELDMYIRMYAHFSNSLGQEKSELSKTSNRNLMKKRGTGKNLSAKNELSGEVEQQRY